jgi:hypothetical protein
MRGKTFDFVCDAVAVAWLVVLMVFEVLRRWKLRQAPYRVVVACKPAEVDAAGNLEQTLTLECGHTLRIRVGRRDSFACDECRDAR